MPAPANLPLGEVQVTSGKWLVFTLCIGWCVTIKSVQVGETRNYPERKERASGGMM